MINIDKLKLSRASSVPLYLQLQNFFINEIKLNNLKEGDMLLTEIELSNLLKISRPTVRQALNNLVNQGYLNRIKGTGTFVTKPKIMQDYTNTIEGYNIQMMQKGLIPKTKVLELKVIEANKIISSKLQIDISEKVIKLKRLRFAYPESQKEISPGDNKPMLITTVYTPYNLIPQMLNYDFEVFSFYEVINKNNLFVNKGIRELEAKLADKETANILQIKTGAPIFYIVGLCFLQNGKPIEYSENIYPGERNKFIVKI